MSEGEDKEFPADNYDYLSTRSILLLNMNLLRQELNYIWEKGGKKWKDKEFDAQEFADSYRVYHNFVRPQGGLPNNQTPAEATGIDLHLGKNKIMSLIQKSTEPEHRFAIQLRHRIDYVKIVNENDCIRIVPKAWIEKRMWREINDILRLHRFCWLKNGKDGCWIRLKQRSLMEYF